MSIFEFRKPPGQPHRNQLAMLRKTLEGLEADPEETQQTAELKRILAGRIAELERKIGQLTMENDFLKKALEHFRDHHPPAVVSGEVACLRKSGKPQKRVKGRS